MADPWNLPTELYPGWPGPSFPAPPAGAPSCSYLRAVRDHYAFSRDGFAFMKEHWNRGVTHIGQLIAEEEASPSGMLVEVSHFQFKPITRRDLTIHSSYQYSRTSYGNGWVFEYADVFGQIAEMEGMVESVPGAGGTNSTLPPGATITRRVTSHTPHLGWGYSRLDWLKLTREHLKGLYQINFAAHAAAVADYNSAVAAVSAAGCSP